MSKLEFLIAELERLYRAEPERSARAPGRVHVLGEHADCSDGFVMPIAIERQVMLAARRRRAQCVRVTALDMHGKECDEFALGSIGRCHDYRRANLDVMVKLSRRRPGGYAARLTGAGWGDATVNLVQTSQVNSFIANVTRDSVAETGIGTRVAPLRASSGAGRIASPQGEVTR